MIDLSVLQEVQSSFDRSRGFQFEKFSEKIESLGISDLDRALLLQFSSLGICGEVGELANKIKKISRSKMLDDDFVTNYSECLGELADVLSYLLKISNLLGGDLLQIYLEKMCVNCFRFPARLNFPKKILTISGCSGSGKTTLVTGLSKAISNCAVYVESPEKNSYLIDSLHKKNSESIFNSQLWFLSEQLRFVRENINSDLIILDQDPVAIVLVYGRFFLDNHLLKKDDYQRLMRQLLKFEDALAESGFVRSSIYLGVSKSTAAIRLKGRGYKTDPLGDILADEFEEFFSGFSNVLKIDSEMASKDKLLGEVLSYVE